MKNFTIKNKWRQILCGHSEALRGEVYNAVVEYVAEGRIVEMSEAAAVAFDFIRYDIDASSRSKAKRVERKDNAVSEERVGCEVMTPEAEATVAEERAGCEVKTPEAETTVAESREAESSGGEVDAEVMPEASSSEPVQGIKVSPVYAPQVKTKHFKRVKVSKILKGRGQRGKSSSKW